MIPEFICTNSHRITFTQQELRGIYKGKLKKVLWEFNLRELLEKDYKKRKLPAPALGLKFKVMTDYGVSLSLEDIQKQYGFLNKIKGRNFIICIREVHKSDQPPRDGWRWHKWGQLISKYQPQYEYLYDEPIIDMVYIFHVYEMIDNVKTSYNVQIVSS